MGSRALLVRRANNLLMSVNNTSEQCKRSYKKFGDVIGYYIYGVDFTKSRQQSDTALQEYDDSKKFVQTDKLRKTEIEIEGQEDAVGLVSGYPEEHIKTRTVRISQPTKNAMQSGTNNTSGWKISFDTRERWENPLMGWCSSGDPLQALRVHFESLESAIQHCRNMGWQYTVQKSNTVNPKPRTYGDNFSWNKRTRVSTK